MRVCLGAVWYWRHPGVAEERVAHGVRTQAWCLAAVGDVAADGVAVAGGVLGTEAAGDLLLGLGRAQVAFGLVAGGRDAQVGCEAQDVVLAIAQVFRELLAALAEALSDAARGKAASSAGPTLTPAR